MLNGRSGKPTRVGKPWAANDNSSLVLLVDAKPEREGRKARPHKCENDMHKADVGAAAVSELCPFVQVCALSFCCHASCWLWSDSIGGGYELFKGGWNPQALEVGASTVVGRGDRQLRLCAEMLSLIHSLTGTRTIANSLPIMGFLHGCTCFFNSAQWYFWFWFYFIFMGNS